METLNITRVGKYEYTTIALDSVSMNDPKVKKMEADGWTVSWGDCTTEGTFRVFRREVEQRNDWPDGRIVFLVKNSVSDASEHATGQRLAYSDYQDAEMARHEQTPGNGSVEPYVPVRDVLALIGAASGDLAEALRDLIDGIETE